MITSEYATVNTRGRMIAAVFAMQGLGQLTAGIVCITVIYAFRNAINEDPLNTDYVWRICLGLGMTQVNGRALIIVGCVPAVMGAYFRHKLPETPRFTAQVKGDHAQAQKDINTVVSDNESTMVRDKSEMEVSANYQEYQPILSYKRVSVQVASVQGDPGVVNYNSTNNEFDSSSRATASDDTVTWASFKAHYSQWRNFKVCMCEHLYAHLVQIFIVVRFYLDAPSHGFSSISLFMVLV